MLLPDSGTGVVIYESANGRVGNGRGGYSHIETVRRVASAVSEQCCPAGVEVSDPIV